MKVDRELKFYNHDYSINGLYYLQTHRISIIWEEWKVKRSINIESYKEKIKINWIDWNKCK